MIIRGNRSTIKRQILDYCLEHFEEESIWLIDSLQIFDPYYLSRKDTEMTRQMLDNIRICRPFTLFQLRDKIFTLTKITLNQNSTIIISAINCFQSDTRNKDEIKAVKHSILETLKQIKQQYLCKIILGKWEGQSGQCDMKLKPSLQS